MTPTEFYGLGMRLKKATECCPWSNCKECPYNRVAVCWPTIMKDMGIWMDDAEKRLGMQEKEIDRLAKDGRMKQMYEQMEHDK